MTSRQRMRRLAIWQGAAFPLVFAVALIAVDAIARL
jgi:hypothetical protein